MNAKHLAAFAVLLIAAHAAWADTIKLSGSWSNLDGASAAGEFTLTGLDGQSVSGLRVSGGAEDFRAYNLPSGGAYFQSWCADVFEPYSFAGASARSDNTDFGSARWNTGTESSGHFDSDRDSSRVSEYGAATVAHWLHHAHDISGNAPDTNHWRLYGDRPGRGAAEDDHVFGVHTIAAVPVPASLPLLALGLAVLGLTARRRRCL